MIGVMNYTSMILKRIANKKMQRTGGEAWFFLFLAPRPPTADFDVSSQ